jgi:hypothetical protein
VLIPPTGSEWRRLKHKRGLNRVGGNTRLGFRHAAATSVTRDGLPQIDVEEAVQGAPERAAVGAFGSLKPTLADERLYFAVAQLNGHADELGGASMASEALEPRFVDRLRALRGPGESYSDVILRLVKS